MMRVRRTGLLVALLGFFITACAADAASDPSPAATAVAPGEVRVFARVSPGEAVVATICAPPADLPELDSVRVIEFCDLSTTDAVDADQSGAIDTTLRRVPSRITLVNGMEVDCAQVSNCQVVLATSDLQRVLWRLPVDLLQFMPENDIAPIGETDIIVVSQEPTSPGSVQVTLRIEGVPSGQAIAVAQCAVDIAGVAGCDVGRSLISELDASATVVLTAHREFLTESGTPIDCGSTPCELRLALLPGLDLVGTVPLGDSWEQ